MDQPAPADAPLAYDHRATLADRSSAPTGARLSPLQTAWWLAERAAMPLAGASTHLALEIDVEGASPGAITDAWREVVRAVPALRSTVADDGRIVPSGDAQKVKVLDLSGVAAPEPALAALRARHRDEDLPLAAGEPWRLALTRLAGGRVRAHARFNFARLDFASVLAVLRAWGRALRAPGTLAALPELAPSPAWAGRADAAAAWSESRLAPPPAVPTRVEPAALGRPSPRRLELTLDGASRRGLEAAAAARGLALADAAYAAFGLALQAWSGRDAATLTVATFARDGAPIDAVGEACALTLAELPAAGGEPFAGWARAAADGLADALSRRGDAVLAVARRALDGGGQGFPIVFTDLLAGADPAGLDGATAALGRRVWTITRTPQAWLDCQLRSEGPGLAIAWDHPAGLFDEALLEALFGAFGGLVRALADDATWALPVDVLMARMLPDAQRATRERVNATDVPHDPRTLGALVLEQAARSPETLAVMAADRALTYAELVDEALRVGAWLRAEGLERGGVVAIQTHKGSREVVAALGALLAGGVYLPIDAGLPAARQRMLRELGGPGWVVTEAGVEVELGDLALPTLRLGVDPLPARGLGGDLARRDDLAYVLFTSGSTGVPKGVMIRHRSAVNTIVDVDRRFAVGARDRVLGLSALSFDLSVWDLFGPLAVGGALVLPGAAERRDPLAWADLVEACGVTIWNSVPSALGALVDALEAAGREVPTSLRLGLLSGDWIPLALPGRVAAKAPGMALVSLGGATEGAIWSIAHPIAQVDPAWRSIPYGTPLANQRFHVVHDNLAPCPDGVTGELCIAGEGVAAGYWEDPERTAAAFVTHPRTGERLYRTGDLGRYRADGVIELLGRRDAQVKIQGHRIELGEVEHAAAADPAVRAAVARVIGERDGHRRLVLYVVPAVAGEVLDEATLRRHLAARLPEPMVPSRIVTIAAVPLSSNGKVDRAALPLPAAPQAGERGASATAARAPSALEAAIALAWRTLLRVPTVGLDDDFFALGGDSLLAIQIASHLARAGVRLSAAAFFDHRTVASQAAVAERIEAQAGPGDDGDDGLIALGAGQQIFLDHGFGDPDAWNEGFILDARAPLDAHAMGRALDAVAAHHAALRTRLWRGPDGVWQQRVRGAVGPEAPDARHVPLEVVTVDAGSDDAVRDAVARVARGLERAIALGDGPVCAAAIVRARPARSARPGDVDPVADRLVIVGHQALLDGFSWRLVLEDLQSAYRALVGGEAPRLAPVTTRFGQWTAFLAEHARGPEVAAELERWRQIASVDAGFPRDLDACASGETLAFHATTLDLATSEALLRGATRTHAVSAQELLLGALAATLGRWTGRPEAALEVFAHGREPLMPGAELARTTGRFTTTFPLALGVGATVEETVARAARELRAVPLRGLRYGLLRSGLAGPAARATLAAGPAPAVAFNYVGHFDPVIGDREVFATLHDLPKTRALVGPRRHELEVHAYVLEGRLTLELRYSRSTHREATIARFAAELRQAVVSLARPLEARAEPGRVLVVGATGALGSQVARALMQRGHAVTALARDPAGPRAEALATAGARLVHGDLADRAALVEALAGCRAVVFTATGVDCKAGTGELERADRAGLAALVDACEGRGLDRFVYVSMSRGIAVPSPMLGVKRAGEALLRASSLPWVVLRPTFFMETWFRAKSGIDPDRAHATLYGGGRAPVSYVAQADVAQAAARAVSLEGAARRTFELGGAPVAPREILGRIVAASGAPWTVDEADLAALRASSEAAPEPVVRSVLALRAAHGLGDVVDPTGLAALGVTATRLEDWLAARGVPVATPPAPSPDQRVATATQAGSATSSGPGPNVVVSAART